MTEYEEKIKQAKNLCKWFGEHAVRTKAEGDSVLIAVVDKNYIGDMCGVGTQEGMERIISKALSEMAPSGKRVMLYKGE